MSKIDGAAEAAADGDARAPRAKPPTTTAILSPSAWSKAYFPVSVTGRINDDMWRHSAASQLHGWANHIRVMGVPMQLDQDAYEGALAAVSGTTLDPYPDALFVDPSLPVVGGQLPRVPRVPPLHGDTLPVLPPLHGATLPTIPGIDNALPTPPDPPPEMADDQSRREKSSDKPLPKGAR